MEVHRACIERGLICSLDKGGMGGGRGLRRISVFVFAFVAHSPNFLFFSKYSRYGSLSPLPRAPRGGPFLSSVNVFGIGPGEPESLYFFCLMGWVGYKVCRHKYLIICYEYDRV